MTALLDRMASPEIETAAAEHDVAPPLEIGVPPTARRPITGSARAVIWEGSLPADAARDYARRHLGLDVDERSRGRRRRARAPIAPRSSGSQQTPRSTLIVFTPAWEPPLLELLDFLAELRRRVGPARVDRRGAGARRARAP